MFRFLCLVAFLSAFLSRAPAVAQMQAYNATGPEFVDIWVPEQDYAKQKQSYSVVRAVGVPVRVRIIASLKPLGYTGIENTTHYPWPVDSWWVGFKTTMRHASGGTFATATTPYGWSNTTTQDMGATYSSVLVGPNLPFDGEVDWMGPSGRSWQIRGHHVIERVVTQDLAAWTQGDAQGLHHFEIEFAPRGWFGSGHPPTSHWQGFARGHTRVQVVVQYEYDQ